MDPLAEVNYCISPYVYCKGNVVNRIDPTGMYDLPTRITSTFVTKDHIVIEHRDDGDNKVYRVENVFEWRKNGSKKEGLDYSGTEDPFVTYKKGDKYIYFPSYRNWEDAIRYHLNTRVITQEDEDQIMKTLLPIIKGMTLLNPLVSIINSVKTITSSQDIFENNVDNVDKALGGVSIVAIGSSKLIKPSWVRLFIKQFSSNLDEFSVVNTTATELKKEYKNGNEISNNIKEKE